MASDRNPSTDVTHNSTLCAQKPYPGLNTVFVFSGRWKFLTIQFPYLFANLRANGGVIDRIMYMMVKYDNNTHDKLLHLSDVVNRLLQQEVITLNYMGYTPKQPPLKYESAYYDLIEDIIRNPNNAYFKLDDDVVYIHPGTFESMIHRDRSTPCTISFGNIAGANWRCSWIHQEMGLYNDNLINPGGLKFNYDPFANCGWNSLECAKLSLNRFLSLYNNRQLSRYLFAGNLSLKDKHRFSINFFMINNETINFKAFIRSFPINSDDEDWWTVKYVKEMAPHCVIGNALVVHFSYSTTSEALMKLNLIDEFERIAYKENTNIPDQVWTVLHRT